MSTCCQYKLLKPAPPWAAGVCSWTQNNWFYSLDSVFLLFLMFFLHFWLPQCDCIYNTTLKGVIKVTLGHKAGHLTQHEHYLIRREKGVHRAEVIQGHCEKTVMCKLSRDGILPQTPCWHLLLGSQPLEQL